MKRSPILRVGTATKRGSSMRAAVFERDKGVCARCKTPTLDNKQAIDELLRVARGDRHLTAKALELKRLYADVCAYEVDHDPPLCESRADLGLDGLRTLCVKCHRKVTAELAARNARRPRRRA